MDTSAINEAITLVRRVADLGKRATNVQYEEALIAAREALVSLREETLQLRDELEKVKRRNGFITDKSVCWLKSDTDYEQPYCPVCFAKGLEIPLQKVWEDRPKEQTEWYCPNNKDCGHSYNPWSHHEPESQPESSYEPLFGSDQRY